MTREEAIQLLSQRPMIAPSKTNKQKKFEEATDMAIEALSGQNERPTVIKCKIAMFPEDFKVWAERMKENNPNNNIVVIPYDAEYVSGEERVDECE